MSWVLEDGPCSRGKREKLEVAELMDELWFFHNMLAARTAPIKPTPDSSPNTSKRSIARAKRERTTPPTTSTFLPKLHHSSPSANLLRKHSLLSLPPPTSKEKAAQENGITHQQICGKLRRWFNSCPCTKPSLTHRAISHSSPYSKVDETGWQRIGIPRPQGRLQQANSCFEGEGEKREERKSMLQRVHSCFEGGGEKREEKKSRSRRVDSCFEGGGEKREEKKSKLRRANSSFEVEGENREERTSMRWKMGYKGANIQVPRQFPLSRFDFEGEKRDGRKNRLQRANSCFEGNDEKREEKKSRSQRVHSCFEGRGEKREEKNSWSQRVNSCLEGGGEKREEKKSRLRAANSCFDVEGVNREERTSLRCMMGHKGATVQGPSRIRRLKSLKELELEEVQGFMDLGIAFDESNMSPSILSIIPGLKKQRQTQEDDSRDEKVARPYLSEAWLVQSPHPPLPRPCLLNVNWVDGKSSVDMKEQLKEWARIVTFNIQQEC